MTPHVRQATIKDRDPICAIHLESWQASYRYDVSPDAWKTVFPVEMKRKWAARTFRYPELILVAEEHQLIGFIFALLDRDTPFIDNLHVRPGLQSRGTGTLLLEAAFTELRLKGYETATLDVLETNQRALDFYVRLGGRDIGQCHGDLFGQKVAERRLEFDLRNI